MTNLRGRKERFLQQQLDELNGKAADAHRELARLQVEEESLVTTLRQTRAFEIALEARADLHEKLKQVGGLEESLNAIQSLRASLDDIDSKLEATRKTVRMERRS